MPAEQTVASRTPVETSRGGSAALEGVLLAHVPTHGPPEALRLAVRLAQPDSGGVVAVGAEAFQPVMFAGMEYMPNTMMQSLLDALKQRLDDAKGRFMLETQTMGARACWHSADDFPDAAMARYARGADWVIAVRPPKHVGIGLEPPISSLIMKTGLPVLVAPTTETPLSAQRIVIGWRDSIEASRAISGAMPLLKAANQVVVVAVDEQPEGEGGDGLNEVCQRLERRGCTATSERRAKGSQSVAAALVQAARDHDADLLVVGGYAHSRLQEWVLGGVTRDLIEACPIYVLFSH